MFILSAADNQGESPWVIDCTLAVNQIANQAPWGMALTDHSSSLQAAVIFGKNRQPLRLIDDPLFRDFLDSVTPNAVLPSSAERRRKILELSANFETNFTKTLASSEFISLMIDGVSIEPRT
jgi:hypothetical protein